jgi:hypothetical protein
MSEIVKSAAVTNLSNILASPVTNQTFCRKVFYKDGIHSLLLTFRIFVQPLLSSSPGMHKVS